MVILKNKRCVNVDLIKYCVFKQRFWRKNTNAPIPRYSEDKQHVKQGKCLRSSMFWFSWSYYYYFIFYNLPRRVWEDKRIMSGYDMGRRFFDNTMNMGFSSWSRDSLFLCISYSSGIIRHYTYVGNTQQSEAYNDSGVKIKYTRHYINSAI